MKIGQSYRDDIILNGFLQIQFVVGRKESGAGFVAVDDIEFKFIELCEFTPPEAKPVTTTKAPTTVEPTEPPDCTYQ